MTDISPVSVDNLPLDSALTDVLGNRTYQDGISQTVRVPVAGLASLLAPYGTVVSFGTRAQMDAALTYPENTGAYVWADSTVANTGVYRKTGASGSGSWTRVADLPAAVIMASNAGAGTANALVATSAMPVAEGSLVRVNVIATNTVSPATVSFNGGTALTIKTNAGNNVSVGGLVSGSWLLGIRTGTSFRLVSDQASAAIQAAAEAARDLAEAWAESDTAPSGAGTKSAKTHSGETAAARDLAQQYASDAAVVSGVNVPIYASVASAAGATIVAGVKVIRTQAYAPVYITPGTLRGAAEYIRVSKAAIDSAGYPALAYFRSTDRFMPDGTTDSTNGGYWLINEQRLSPAMFGAVLDGTADDTAAAQACADMCIRTGREFIFPRGFLRLTAGLKFGRDIYNNLAWVKGTNGKLASVQAAALAAYNSTNFAYNVANTHPCNLYVESGSYVIADFTATNEDPKAVISYNLRGDGVAFTHSIYGSPLIIGTPVNIIGGRFVTDADYGVIPDNGLIGMWFPGVQRSILGTLAPNKMGYSGVASFISYQSDFQNIYAHHCGDGATVWEHNSGRVSVTANDCARGLVTFGDAMEASIGTQQCRQDFLYTEGDGLVLKLRYIEDFSPGATDGAGAAAVQLGISGGGSGQVRNATIIGGRFGTIRANKKSIIGYGAANVTHIGTRFLNKLPDYDANSSGTYINTDLLSLTQVPKGQFSVVAAGQINARYSNGVGQLTNEGWFAVTPASSSLTLAAGATVTKTVTLPAGTVPANAGLTLYNHAVGQVHFPIAYPQIVGRVTAFDAATQTFTLHFYNPSASSVTFNQGFRVHYQLLYCDAFAMDA